MRQVRHKRLTDHPGMRWDVLSEERTGYIGQRTGTYKRFLPKDDYELVPEPIKAPTRFWRAMEIGAWVVVGVWVGVLIYLWVVAP